MIMQFRDIFMEYCRISCVMALHISVSVLWPFISTARPFIRSKTFFVII